MTGLLTGTLLAQMKIAAKLWGRRQEERLQRLNFRVVRIFIVSSHVIDQGCWLSPVTLPPHGALVQRQRQTT